MFKINYKFNYYFNNNQIHQERCENVECGIQISKIETKIKRNNIADLLLKSPNHLRVLELLISKNQSFYNVLKFCKENNEKVYEIEIIKNIKNDETDYYQKEYFGYHIFATFNENLENIIKRKKIPLYEAFSTVKWIKNYQYIYEDNLIYFIKNINDLKSNKDDTDDWIVIKNDDYKNKNKKISYDEISDLFFIYDLRRYCGDIKDLNSDYINNPDELQQIIQEFHQNYVVQPDNQPKRKIVWKFLQQLNSGWKFIEENLDLLKNLDWKNVEGWNKYDRIQNDSTSSLASDVNNASGSSNKTYDNQHIDDYRCLYGQSTSTSSTSKSTYPENYVNYNLYNYPTLEERRINTQISFLPGYSFYVTNENESNMGYQPSQSHYFDKMLDELMRAMFLTSREEEYIELTRKQNNSSNSRSSDT